MDVRTLLAAVLGCVLGVVFLAAPDAVYRAWVGGRRPHGGRGEYGTDSSPPARVRHLVRVVGLALLAFGLYFGATLVGLA